jgi:hypothetical protein
MQVILLYPIYLLRKYRNTVSCFIAAYEAEFERCTRFTATLRRLLIQAYALPGAKAAWYYGVSAEARTER